MGRGIRSLAVLTACAGSVVAAAAPASADAMGTVLVFRNEFVETIRYVDPSGCTTLPVDAHLLTNLTDSDITIYNDPLCMTYSTVVPPGYGAHVPPVVSSFSA